MSPLFRDLQLPSHAMDRRAHERFQLDTYADRRAEARRAPGVGARAWLRSVLVKARLAE